MRISFLLHILLLTCRRNSLLLHYPSNSLSSTYLAVSHIVANMLDMHVQYIGSLYHCDAITLPGGDGAPGLVLVLVLPGSHHNCSISTSLPPFESTHPKSLPNRANPASSGYT